MASYFTIFSKNPDFLFSGFKNRCGISIWIMISFGEIKIKTIDILFYSLLVLENKCFIISLIVYWLSANKILKEHLRL